MKKSIKPSKTRVWELKEILSLIKKDLTKKEFTIERCAMKFIVKDRKLASIEMNVNNFKNEFKKNLNIARAVLKSCKVTFKEDWTVEDKFVLNSLIEQHDWGCFIRDLEVFNGDINHIEFYESNVSDLTAYEPLYQLHSSQMFAFSPVKKEGSCGWEPEMFLIDEVILDSNDVIRNFIARQVYSPERSFFDTEKQLRKTQKARGAENEEGSD